MTHLAIDLLGADTPQEELCRGAVAALKKTKALFLSLCGDREVIAPLMEKSGIPQDRYEVVHAPVAITNYDDPMTCYKQENASLVRAMQIAHDSGGGVVSCGATGAVLVSSIMILGKINRLHPILAVELVNVNGGALLLLDCGANIDTRPELYPSFAHLGNAYMHCIGNADPRIALLSNGAEETKGCEAVKAAHVLLKQEKGIRFIGNVEATHALDGTTDVIVCDGFHGNILLKSIEGTAKAVISELEARTRAFPALGPMTAHLLQDIRKKYDYNTQGGAILLGVSRPVMKGHGSATGEAVEKMIDRAGALVRNGFVEQVKKEL